MTRPTVLRLAGCAAVICSSMGWAASPAWASRASIRAAIVSYMPRVDVAEGHVLVALGEYKERHDPAPLEAAIADSVSVIGELRQAVAHQSAVARRVKTARAKVEQGLANVILGYEDLSRAYAVKAQSEEEAKVEAVAAEVAVTKGRVQLAEGLKLLT